MLKHLLLVFVCFSLCGEETKSPPIQPLYNNPLSSAPKVNVITGTYHEEECDLVVAGCQPISIRRFYASHVATPHENRYGQWRLNPECTMRANFTLKDVKKSVAVGEATGEVIEYTRPDFDTYRFAPSLQKGFVHVGGNTHPSNTSISYQQCNPDSKNDKRFQWTGEITDGSGRVRTFLTPMHGWNEKRNVHHSNNYIKAYSPRAWTPFACNVTKETLPNGNQLEYTYGRFFKHDYLPTPDQLTSIKALSAEGTLLGQINLSYDNSENKRTLKNTSIYGSDQRRVLYKCQKKEGPCNTEFGSMYICSLSEVDTPNQPKRSYSPFPAIKQSCSEHEPELSTVYDSKFQKVKSQKAPVGPSGQLVPIFTFDYQKNHTIVHDAEHNKKIHHFEDQRITRVATFQGKTLYCNETFKWCKTTGNLLEKALLTPDGTLCKRQTYVYDERQNLIEETLSDDKDSHTIYRTYTMDNMLATESDRPGKLVRYLYLPETNLVLQKLTYDHGKLRHRTFYDYADGAICIQEITDDGCTVDPQNLIGVNTRRVIDYTPKRSFPCYGLPEQIKDSTGPTTHITYHPSGQVTSQERNGALTTNTYDSRERLISTTDPEGHTTTFTYDKHNNLTSRTGKHRTTWHYDKAHRPTAITTDGLTTTRTYDLLSRLVSQRDPCGRITQYTYDALSRLTKITHPNGSQTKRTYDICGNLTSETDPNGHTTHKTYDFRGSVTSITHPDGSQEHFTYTLEGNRASHTNTSGITTTYTYDIFDHVIATQTLDKHTSATYTPFHCLSETDASGITTTYTYDICGRKTSQQTLDKIVTYTYDTNGRLETQTEGDTLTRCTYNNLDQLIEKTTFSGDTLLRQESYAYDADGNRTHLTNTKGTTLTEYNALNKPIQITDPLGNITTITYTCRGNLTKTTTRPDGVQAIETLDFRNQPLSLFKKDPSGNILSHTDYTYDPAGNKLQETHHIYPSRKTTTHTWTYNSRNQPLTFLEADTKLTTFTYDDVGRLSSTTKPDGTTLHRTYDPYARLSHHSGPDFDEHYTYDLSDRVLTAGETTRAYDPYGNLIQETLATNLTFSSTYDPYGRRTSLTLPDQTSITYTYLGPDLHTVTRNNYTFTYTRDLEGLPTQIDTPLGPLLTTYDSLGHIVSLSSPHTDATYTYDTLGRLIHTLSTDPLGQTESAYTYDFLDQLLSENDATYTYDSLSNRLTKDTDDYDVNALCQVTHDGQSTYTYDTNGNLLEDEHHTYTYDSRDRLIAVDDHTYTYDAFNRRLSKNDTLYYWDRTLEIGSSSELRVLGTGLGAEIGASLLLELDHTPYIPLHDQRGNLIVLLDLDNTPIQTLRYTAFGEHDATTLPWTFASKRYDPESSLIYFGRRYYNPNLGRWLTPDPAGFADGPNLYTYVHNNPLTNFDLRGLLTRPAIEPYKPQPHLTYFNAYSLLFNNQPKIFDLKKCGYREFSEGAAAGFINGHANSLVDASRSTHYLGNLAGGHNVTCTFSPTNKAPLDFLESALGLCNIITPPALLLTQTWDTFFKKNPDGRYLQFCHSQGAIHTKLALSIYPPELRKQIDVVAIAPAAYISPELCNRSVHYVSKRDVVPWIDTPGRMIHKDTVRVLNPHPQAPAFDHTFMSPTYSKAITDEIVLFRESLDE